MPKARSNLPPYLRLVAGTAVAPPSRALRRPRRAAAVADKPASLTPDTTHHLYGLVYAAGSLLNDMARAIEAACPEVLKQ